MRICCEISNRVLCFSFHGELDNSSFESSKKMLDDYIHSSIYDKVVFDFKNLSFMDSTGIGLLIGRYKLLKRIGKACYISGCNNSIKKLLDMTGIFSIIKHVDKMEEMV